METDFISTLVSSAGDMVCSVILAWLLYVEIRRRNGKD